MPPVLLANLDAKRPRWVITGGGTGGHIFPALAVIQTIRDVDLQVELHYVGKTLGMEAEKVAGANVPFYGIAFTGMPRKLTWRWLPWLIQLVVATIQLVFQFVCVWKPSVVFSTGGYVTAPVLLAALLTRTPYVVHEPDAHAGLVNRVFSKWAAHVTTAFENTFPTVPLARVTATGNPIRSTIQPVSDQERFEAFQSFFPDANVSENPLVLLVTGGSQGAASINRAVLDALPTLLEQYRQLYVIHQVGASDFEQVTSRFNELPLSSEFQARYWMNAFIDDMPKALASASLALCRSGSLTLSEHCAAGVPMVLVPYPFAAADHQTKNAQRLVDVGAAVMVTDGQLSSERLIGVLTEIMDDASILQTMSQCAQAVGRYQAAELIVEQLNAIATGYVVDFIDLTR